jgi:WD40 repeat protein
LGRADVFYNAKVNYIDRYSESEINDMFVSMDSREFIFSDISPDAKIVASISYNNEILLWELHTAKPIKFLFRHSSRIQKLKFSYDGKLLLTASEDNTIRIIDVNTGKLVKEHKIAIDNPENTREYGFRDAIFSPDSKSVLFVTTGYDIGICEIESGNLKQLFKEKKLYRALFSKDGKKLILELWGTKKNTTYNDGRFITIFDQGKYRILDVSSGAEIKASRDKIKWVLPPYENNDNLVSINGFFANKFGLDYFLENKFIVYNSTKKTFKEYQSGVQYAAVFSPPTEKDPNGAKYILSNGLDGRSIVWETESGRALYTRFQLKNGDWLVYDEHYRYDGSPAAIDLLYFTCGMEIVELSKAKNGLHVPNLVQKIMNGENLEHLPKLKDLKICKN